MFGPWHRPLKGKLWVSQFASLTSTVLQVRTVNCHGDVKHVSLSRLCTCPVPGLMSEKLCLSGSPDMSGFCLFVSLFFGMFFFSFLVFQI